MEFRIAEQPAPSKVRLFEHVAEEALLSYGVPAEWLPDVRQANEDTLLQLADHLPSEAAEALLELAPGGKPQDAQPAATAVCTTAAAQKAADRAARSHGFRSFRSPRCPAPLPGDAQRRGAATCP